MIRLTRRSVPRGDPPVLLGLVKVLDQPVLVALRGVLRDALHAEDLDLEPGAIGQGVFHLLERLLVNLRHVHRQTTGRVESATASVALEVLGLLMGDEKLEILKVALAYPSLIVSVCLENIAATQLARFVQ